MKTREKILQASLLLFNEEGEPNVTTVDIANELEISPGNLYYHFKGKEVIIDVLFSRFEEGFTEILHAPIKKELKVEDSWYYLHVIFEEIYHYRFIYHNINDLLFRYASLAKKFRRLLNLKHQTAKTLITSLRDAGILSIQEKDIDILVGNIVMTTTYWVAYSVLCNEKQDEQVIINKGVFQILSLVSPYLGSGKKEFLDFCDKYYQQVFGEFL